MTTTRRLVPERWRPLAQSAITAGLGVAFVLGVLTFHDGWTSYDSWMLGRLQAYIGPWTAGQLVGFTEPPVSIALIAFAAVGAAAVRRFDVALFAVAAPVVAVVLSSEVLKPLIDRPGPLIVNGQLRTGDFGSFPSGHQTGVTSTALVLFLVACQVPLRRRARVASGAVLLVWVGIASVGLTRAVFHYSSDTVGAVGVSTAVVLGTALAVDRWAPERLRGRAVVPQAEERPRAAQLT